jgi:EAL domain-containing protein (putative c-di-GMP-specific phosphodiesterase class I)
MPHPAPPSGALPSELHERRVERMLHVGSAVVTAAALLWGTVFYAQGYVKLAGVNAGLLALGAVCFWLTRRGHTRAATLMLFLVIYAVIVFDALVLDVPSAAAPRSMHQYLLGLAVMALLLTRDEPRWLHLGLPLLLAGTYLVLDSPYGVPSALALPESIRLPGGWINTALALAGLAGAVHTLQTDLTRRDSLQAELTGALLAGEMVLHYQTQVTTQTQVVGAEALVRWQHPVRGLVPPGEFIPLAERSGLMLPLGDWVLRTACQTLVSWSRHAETAELRLAVNVSASQFAQPDFVAKVQQIVQQTGARPDRLELELTESMLANDLEDIITKMLALKDHGIGFSLDDFGTGFSSLTYLRRLPLDKLKIDQAFVRSLLTSPKDAAIAQAVITLGHSPQAEVIAEGVETKNSANNWPAWAAASARVTCSGARCRWQSFAPRYRGTLPQHKTCARPRRCRCRPESATGAAWSSGHWKRGHHAQTRLRGTTILIIQCDPAAAGKHDGAADRKPQPVARRRACGCGGTGLRKGLEHAFPQLGCDAGPLIPAGPGERVGACRAGLHAHAQCATFRAVANGVVQEVADQLTRQPGVDGRGPLGAFGNLQRKGQIARRDQGRQFQRRLARGRAQGAGSAFPAVTPQLLHASQ